jgi:HD-like signal output (HDOD) protein
MPIALDNPSRSSTTSEAASAPPTQPEFETREAARRLTKLLASAPIDLSGISDEIRRHPDLESLILRPAISLVPSPDEPLGTIEEAVVALGTTRLRTLIGVWSSSSSVGLSILERQQDEVSSV